MLLRRSIHSSRFEGVLLMMIAAAGSFIRPGRSDAPGGGPATSSAGSGSRGGSTGSCRSSSAAGASCRASCRAEGKQAAVGGGPRGSRRDDAGKTSALCALGADALPFSGGRQVGGLAPALANRQPPGGGKQPSRGVASCSGRARQNASVRAAAREIAGGIFQRSPWLRAGRTMATGAHVEWVETQKSYSPRRGAQGTEYEARTSAAITWPGRERRKAKGGGSCPCSSRRSRRHQEWDVIARWGDSGQARVQCPP